ncbi:MAG: GGDEF domain-containing protein [Lachnospiraceae bacterium]|nr:GGDEF domain-containing protein [Lachnospiraceae bacterium]
MSRRKRIGVIIAHPEVVYHRRVLDGICKKCAEYDYDVVCFCVQIQAASDFKRMQMGESNIIRLMNFDRLDAVVVVTISLRDEHQWMVEDLVCERLSRECRIPVVTMELKLRGIGKNYPCLETNDTDAIRMLTEHVLDVHHCKNIYYLAGPDNNAMTAQRLDGFTEAMTSHGLTVDPAKVFYGPFWYNFGEKVAARIISGELALPEAVVCGSDCVAIGFANRLVSAGDRVPEDVIVTGYDAIAEAALNTPSITTCVPDVYRTISDTINLIRKTIDPDQPIIPSFPAKESGLRLNSSCGCMDNIPFLRESAAESIYMAYGGYRFNNLDHVDMGNLMESYFFELLTATSNPLECLREIYRNVEMIRPFEHYYLCLNPEWLNTGEKIEEGYPDRMHLAIHATPVSNTDSRADDFVTMGNEHAFDTRVMLPALDEDRDHASVFYFVPMHFMETCLGYSVLQCSLEQKKKLDSVSHSWFRFVNNALEMTRTKNQLTEYAHQDRLTGLLNRWGMETEIRRMKAEMTKEDKWLVLVIDMDGLKRINDQYSHAEGDIGIRTIALATQRITNSNEICVRAGGDEFFVVGMGKYEDSEAEARIERFHQIMDEENARLGKPYEISASIGAALVPNSIEVNSALEVADARMYRDKVVRKKMREH